MKRVHAEIFSAELLQPKRRRIETTNERILEIKLDTWEKGFPENLNPTMDHYLHSIKFIFEFEGLETTTLWTNVIPFLSFELIICLRSKEGVDEILPLLDICHNDNVIGWRGKIHFLEGKFELESHAFKVQKILVGKEWKPNFFSSKEDEENATHRELIFKIQNFEGVDLWNEYAQDTYRYWLLKQILPLMDLIEYWFQFYPTIKINIVIDLKVYSVSK